MMRSKRRAREEGRSLSPAEVAALMGVSAQQIYKLAAHGVLPHFRVSGELRFDPELIGEWRRRNSLDSTEVIEALSKEEPAADL
jgi:excisionase family DNA binding protein